MDRLASLVLDVKLALQDDLHLVVGVGVDKRGALFESVDTATHGLLRVDLVVADDVAEEGVFVGDQGRLEVRLDFGEVLEC